MFISKWTTAIPRQVDEEEEEEEEALLPRIRGTVLYIIVFLLVSTAYNIQYILINIMIYMENCGDLIIEL